MKQKIIAAMFAITCLLLPVASQAQQPIQVQKPGLGYAGMINFQGAQLAYFVVKPWDGSPCEFHFLGAGGLNGHYRMVGTTLADWWTHAQGSISHCGYTMSPLVQNGLGLHFSGNGGDDVMFGGFGPNTVYGEGGHDTLLHAVHASGAVSGDSGHDLLKGAQLSTDYFFGGEGNDKLCEFQGTIAGLMDGGPDVDSRCGTATTLRNVESVNCAVCGW